VGNSKKWEWERDKRGEKDKREGKGRGREIKKGYYTRGRSTLKSPPPKSKCL
jgi:hypothetical protein